MAPESERAMYPLCTDVLRDQGKPYPRTCAECGLGPCKRKLTASTPKPPTLACSEVVESAPELCNDHYDCRDCAAYLAWRERRVQELEEAHELFLAQLKTALGIADDGRVWFGAGLLARAETLVLRESEWREQIRKGAKHETA